MSPTVTRMLLLRHGQSEWNALGRWQGMADSPLSTVGYDQATATAVVLASLNVDFASVWSSDLSRARSTAEVIADALNLSEVMVDPHLREADAGEWQGLTHADIRRDWPGYLEAHRRPPDFELFESVVARAVTALATIAAHPSSATGAVVVVTHSGLIRSLLRHLDGTDPRVANLGGAWVDVTTAGDTSEINGAVTAMFDPAAFDPAMPSSSADVLGEEPGAAQL
jgi:broad specificity phosphatase PhoE